MSTAGLPVVRVNPPRTLASAANIGSSKVLADGGGRPAANTPMTRCCPARNEVKM
ncbi:MAG: hypothetical protein ACM32E_14450 [Gemmatimonadota bacterium]